MQQVVPERQGTGTTELRSLVSVPCSFARRRPSSIDGLSISTYHADHPACPALEGICRNAAQTWHQYPADRSRGPRRIGRENEWLQSRKSLPRIGTTLALIQDRSPAKIILLLVTVGCRGGFLLRIKMQTHEQTWRVQNNQSDSKCSALLSS